LETYVSNYFHKRILHEKYNDNFSYFITSGKIEYATCLKANPLIIKLFFMSIYWRCSITTKEPFAEFKIKEEYLLRLDLLRHKTSDIKEFEKKTADKNINEKSLIVVKSTNMKNQTNNFIYAQASEDNTYGIVFNEYITFLAVEETPRIRKLNYFTNKGTLPFLVILASNDLWLTFKNMIIEHFRELKTKSLTEKNDYTDNKI